MESLRPVITVRTASNVPKDLSEIIIRDENNVPRVITERWIRDENNVLRQVWGGSAGGGAGALAAVASPDYVEGSIAKAIGGRATTNETTVTVTGGLAPYTYAWDSGTDLAPTAPTSATSAFSRIVGPGESFNDTFTCTVTDSLGAVIASNVVSASVSNYWSA